MSSIPVKTHIGPDGILTLHVPAELCEANVEGLLILHPIRKEGSSPRPMAVEWPAGYFEHTIGGWQGDLKRAPQGSDDVE